VSRINYCKDRNVRI